MISLFGMFCGDIVYESLEDTKNTGIFRQLILIVYLLIFYTAGQNIFVAIIMEGYDRSTLRKEIDNDDPFPILDSLVGSIKKDEKGETREIEMHADNSLMYPTDDPAQGCKLF
jgi:hypothetical protein